MDRSASGSLDRRAGPPRLRIAVSGLLLSAELRVAGPMVLPQPIAELVRLFGHACVRPLPSPARPHEPPSAVSRALTFLCQGFARLPKPPERPDVPQRDRPVALSGGPPRGFARPDVPRHDRQRMSCPRTAAPAGVQAARGSCRASGWPSLPSRGPSWRRLGRCSAARWPRT